MFSLAVSALWQNRVYHDIDIFCPTHIISVIDPIYVFDKSINVTASHHLVIRTWDKTTAIDNVLNSDQLYSIKDFINVIRSTLYNDSVRLLVHCHLGASRSPATAYLFLSQICRDIRCDIAFDELLKITEKPWPNIAMIKQFDDFFEYDGRLLNPVIHYRNANKYRADAYRRFNRIHNRVPINISNAKNGVII